MANYVLLGYTSVTVRLAGEDPSIGITRVGWSLAPSNVVVRK